jgi:hypothetical protein
MRFSVFSLVSLLPGALCLVPLKNANHPKAIPGEYVVVYKAGVTDDRRKSCEDSLKAKDDGSLRHAYTINNFKGFGARLTSLGLARMLLLDRDVRTQFLKCLIAD